MFLRICSTLLLCFVSLDALAIRGVFSANYSKVGSSLSGVTGGQDYDLKAGQGWGLSGGVLFVISDTRPHRFELQVTAGYLSESDGGSNDAVTWRRFPLDAIYYYHNTRNLFRLGGGAIFHIENQLEAKGVNSSAEMRVNNAWGWTAAIEMCSPPLENNNFVSFGVRYNSIKYNSPGFAHEADGSGFMLTTSFLGF